MESGLNSFFGEVVDYGWKFYYFHFFMFEPSLVTCRLEIKNQKVAQASLNSWQAPRYDRSSHSKGYVSW